MCDKVYVLSRGSDHEGGHFIGIYANKDAAIKAVEKQNCAFKGGWILDGVDTWQNGCDYLTIEECDVEE